ncbi:hypothetical protein CV102_13465 [Natronococcus pandeyae]|uniref:PKD domain-containing protein n=1 Tax=Natronococcus pandeyae TaxID=2055836 RepID=A0A8J8Q3I0_9EURY|nr:PKD domain-containing protein [Natronococcus pandeyae]TYL38202.1 hypothetical protein CV102_13465 [Natronococcus pandeyae]
MPYESGRREFMVVTGGTVLSAGLLSGSGTAGAETGAMNPQSAEEISDEKYVIETNDGLALYDPTDGDPRQDDDQVLESATQTAGDEVRVAVTAVPVGPSFPSNGVADIWLGTYDTTGTATTGLESEAMTAQVERPDGTTDSFNVTTDENGGAHIEYDLSDESREDGTYTISVEHDETETTTQLQFSVGTWIDLTTRTFDPVHVDKEVTFAFLARNGEYPESDVELEMTVENPDGELVADQVATTDEDGFATISFTPHQTGAYRIEGVETTEGDQSAGGRVTAADVTGGQNLSLRHAIPGTESVYGGYLYDGDEMVADTTVTLQFRTNWDDEPVLEEEVTTDAGGFFLLEYELPSDVEEDLTVTAELSDEREVELTVDRIRVNEFDEGDDSDDEDESEDVSFGAWMWSPEPGEPVQIELGADDAGEPIVDEQVDIFLQYDHIGAPALSTSVTTDEDGTATTTFSVPESVPDNIWLGGEAVLQYEDEQYTSSIFASLQAYNINFSPSAIPGEESEFSVSATEIGTDEPSADIPLLFDAHYGTDSTGSFGTEYLLTDSDGQDSTSVAIPNDVRFHEYVNYINRYTSTTTYRWLEPEHPGSLTFADDTATPGGTIDVEFTTPDDSTAYGIVFASTWSPRDTIGARITSEEIVSLSIPDHTAGDSLSLRVWATDESGRYYSDTEWITVEDGEHPPTADFDVSLPEPYVDETVEFDAGPSAPGDASIVDYLWTIESDDSVELTGKSVTYAFPNSGEQTVSLTVTDANGHSDSTAETVAVLEGSPPEEAEDYADEETGKVETDGLRDGVDDWRLGRSDTDLLRDVIDLWRSS